MRSKSDVVVVGGGVIGCSVSYALSRRGLSVTLLDAALPGRATSASAGGLWAVGESLGLGCGVILHAAVGDGAGDGGGPQPLPRVFMDFLRRSNAVFSGLRQELREVTGIDIEAESGTGLLYLVYDERQERHGRSILRSLAEDRAAAEWWSAEEVWRHDPLITRELRGAVHFPGDNQVNPMLLSEGYRRAAAACGARVVPEARVTGFQVEGGIVRAVEFTGGTISCGAVVNAAGAWSGRVAALVGIELPVSPVRGQILCTETLRRVLHCNLSTPDCYLLQKAHGEVIIGSTTESCGFDNGVRPTDLYALAAGARRAMPALARAAIKRSWSGLRPGTPDELPILGPSGSVPNLYHATGGFRTGIVAAPLSGEIVAASVVGEDPAFPLEPFLAARFQRPSALEVSAVVVGARA